MKKVLVIAYYWPPAGGPGVQRWLNFIKYLPGFGIEPVLYIPENPHYPLLDQSLLAEVPKELKIYRQPIREPYRWAGFLSPKKTRRISSGIIGDGKQGLLERGMLWVRGNFFIPDARKNWVGPSLKRIPEIIGQEHIDTIITTGPPHSLHLIGMGLKRDMGLTWVADFRDPWTSIGYHGKLKLSKWAQRQHRHMEREVLGACDRVVVTSNTTREEFSTITNTPISVITNGYEPRSIDTKPVMDDKFTLSHIGSLLTGRNPTGLWQALSELVREDGDFARDLQLRFTGVVSHEVMESINSFGLTPYTQVTGYVSHDQARKLQEGSWVLLLVEIDSPETRGIIPGKLFEYMATSRPILAIGPSSWEAGEIVRATRTGTVFDHKEVSRLKEVLLSWHAAYSMGKLEMRTQGVDRFSRRALTEKLARLL